MLLKTQHSIVSTQACSRAGELYVDFGMGGIVKDSPVH